MRRLKSDTTSLTNEWYEFDIKSNHVKFVQLKLVKFMSNSWLESNLPPLTITNSYHCPTMVITLSPKLTTRTIWWSSAVALKLYVGCGSIVTSKSYLIDVGGVVIDALHLNCMMTKFSMAKVRWSKQRRGEKWLQQWVVVSQV